MLFDKVTSNEDWGIGWFEIDKNIYFLFLSIFKRTLSKKVDL